jgi:tight adherence protein B
MNVLWSDPAGFKLVLGALVMMALGIFWLTRIVRIRV